METKQKGMSPPASRGQITARGTEVRSIGVIGSRTLEVCHSEAVGDIVEDLLGRGYHIASGGAKGTDQYVIERLLRAGRCDQGTIYSAWKSYKGFPVTVRAMHRQFKDYGGSIIWGIDPGNGEYTMARVALLKRNEMLVDACYGIVAFINADSKGTIYTIKKAVRNHRPLVVFPVNCDLPNIPTVKWKQLLCGGIWEGAFKAVYLK